MHANQRFLFEKDSFFSAPRISVILQILNYYIKTTGPNKKNVTVTT